MHFVTRKLAALVLIGATAVLTSAAPVGAQTSGWQPGPGAILDNTYDGFIDVPSNGATVPGAGSFNVSGWFVDRDAQGWAGYDDVQVWLGAMDGGGQMLARASIGQNRPDVAAALGNPFWAGSGFTAAVPGSSVPGGPQTLSVYVHTGGKGWWFKQVSVNGGGSGTGTAAPAPSGTATGGPPQVTVSSPTAGQNVSTRSNFTIQGTAIDPGFGGSGIDRVEVWINGARDGQGGTSLGMTTPDSSGAWALEFTPTHFPSTHSNLYIYAHSKNTGLETEVTRDFNITDK